MNLNGAEGERPANSTLPWAGSIWNNNSIGSNFSSTVRDNSRPRGTIGDSSPRHHHFTDATADTNTYMGAAAELIEGKTGSGSLVASSESDTWGYHRSPWRNSAASGVPPVRSSGVSPSRRLSVAQEQSTQHYVDNTPASYFAVARASAIGQGPVAKPSKPLLDPTTRNFTSTRHVDSPMNGFSNFAFGATAEPTSQRPEVPGGPWSDAASLHSPNDDRRSVAASEYFGPTSEAPSRSGSLPSSRHGDPAQYSQTIENYTKYIQAHPRQASSFSHANGRVLQERSGSIQSDSFQMLGRFNLEQDVDQAMHSHRPSVSGTGFPPSFIPPTSDSSYHRDPYADNQAVVRAENGSFAHAGSYTSDGYVSSFNNDHVVQFNPVNFDSRSAPNGASVRQSPFYSHAHTPPVYDHLYPSRGDQTLSDNHSMAVLQGKLQGYQLQQERRNYASPNNLPPQQFHQLALSTHQLRIPYPYAYPMPNGMPNVVHLNGQTPNQLVPVISGMVPMPEPPKGPRDRNPEAQSFMSQLLADFKANKQPNRWSLKDIYSHVVEFSGDQHGSRFIQQKLEQANSDEKDHVFRELQGDSLQLMQDVFGNYVIQKLFEHGDQTQKRILANRMKGHVVHLSTQMYGCRVVQKVCYHNHSICREYSMLIILGSRAYSHRPTSIVGERA
jgi:mRNA-binding protein PUF3